MRVTTQPSRRGLLGGAAAAGVAAPLALALPAEAAVSYTPRRSTGQPLLATAERHLVGRFCYGITPELVTQVKAQGGARAWFDNQLAPSYVADAAADAVNDWWPSLHYGAVKLWDRSKSGTETGWKWDGQLQALGAESPDPQQAAAAGGDDGVLGEPPERPHHRRATTSSSARTTAT